MRRSDATAFNTEMAWIDQRGSEVLSRNECQRLLSLGAGGVGRVGFVEAGQVVMEPVNYRVFESDVVIQVGPGSILDAARAQTIVSFEIDEVSRAEGQAWSVLAQGLARVIDGDHLEGAHPVGTVPLVPEEGRSIVRIRTGVLTGRRFRLRDTEPA